MGTRTILLLCCALLASLAVTQAHGQEGLYCTDKAAQGFISKNRTVNATALGPEKHIVKIISETKRIIQSTPTGDSSRLTCKHPYPGNNLLTCVDRSNLESWAFREASLEQPSIKVTEFTRAYMYGRNTDGEKNIYVAYGTCYPF